MSGTHTEKYEQQRREAIRSAAAVFADKGYHAATVRDICLAAGANVASVNYHFGDKESLVHAVLDKHSEGIEGRRQELLDAAGELPSLRDLVCALVIPVAEKLGDSDGGVAFLKINGQLMANESYATMRLERAHHMDQAKRLSRQFKDILPHESPGDLSARLLLVDCMLFQGLASYASRRPSLPRAGFVAILIDSVISVLSAPVTEEQTECPTHR